MKKLLLSILTLTAITAFAQKDLSVKLLAPTDGYEINAGKPFPVAFTVKNVGTTPILATDSFRIVFAINQSPIRVLAGARALNPGDSANLSPQGGGLAVNFTQNDEQDSALFIVVVGFTDTVANDDPNSANDLDYVFVNLRVFPTGLAQVQSIANSVKVYPNPANTEFTVAMNTSNATVAIMDITGKMVETAPVTMGEARFDVSNYKNGVYFYQVKGENNAVIKSGKFTVSH